MDCDSQSTSSLCNHVLVTYFLGSTPLPLVLFQGTHKLISHNLDPRISILKCTNSLLYLFIVNKVGWPGALSWATIHSLYCKLPYNTLHVWCLFRQALTKTIWFLNNRENDQLMSVYRPSFSFPHQHQIIVRLCLLCLAFS